MGLADGGEWERVFDLHERFARAGSPRNVPATMTPEIKYPSNGNA